MQGNQLRQVWLEQVKQQKAIAVIRASTFQVGIAMAKAVAAGGMPLIEITWNSDRAADLITCLRAELPDCTIGAGTLLHTAQVRQAIAAGAQFLFTPHTQPGLIQLALSQDVPMVPGALSPTELVTAWQAGATAVKVFPIQAVGGVDYIRSLQGPLGQIPLIPTGGVTLTNAAALLQAGAIAVGLSGALFPSEAIAAGDWHIVTQRAQSVVSELAGVRP